MNPAIPQYDFNHPVFKVNLKYKRWARDHVQMASMVSDVIRWEVVEAVSPLQIPVKYHIHYFIRSIVGIDGEQNPVYGNHHILELALTELYPLEACKISMITDVWHPNIKSEGKFKGHVCSNSNGFGLTYDLYQLVLRIGEILQYKNYHAIHTPPFPEDSKVAHWVIEFAEPNGIVDKEKEIFVDDSPLVRRLDDEPDSPATPASIQVAPTTDMAYQPVEPTTEPLPSTMAPAPEVPIAPEPPRPGKIKISAVTRPTPEPKMKITITPKD